jgi:catechol 2,3-dioxygenase-like lactoylglutathione lyase family enzyme
MILDHISVNVADFEKSKAFYLAALEPLGIGVVKDGEGFAGLGRDGAPQFWIGTFGRAPGPIHVAFAAADHAQVRAFYDAALAAGGTDNGAPGIRAHYHPHYYAAYVRDPDGHNIEAVCHTPE